MNSDHERRILFRRLLQEHGDHIYAFALALTGRPDEAEELTASAFAKALRSFDLYDAAKPFHSWMLRIVQNLYLDAKRRGAVRKHVSLDAEAPGEAAQTLFESLADGAKPLDADLESDEARRLVAAALEALPPDFREPLLMCDMLGLEYAAIAKTLHVPVGTVRSRIFRARKLLRERLGPYLRHGGSL